MSYLNEILFFLLHNFFTCSLNLTSSVWSTIYYFLGLQLEFYIEFYLFYLSWIYFFAIERNNTITNPKQQFNVYLTSRF